MLRTSAMMTFYYVGSLRGYLLFEGEQHTTAPQCNICTVDPYSVQ